MLYREAKRIKAKLEAAAKDASTALRSFPRGPTGITPDDVKFSFDFRVAKLRYDTAAHELREFNALYLREFAEQIRFERQSRHDRLVARGEAESDAPI